MVQTFMTCAHSVRSEVDTTKDHNPPRDETSLGYTFITCAHRSVQSEVYALTDPVQRERRGNLGYPFIIVRTSQVRSEVFTTTRSKSHRRDEARPWDTRSSRVHIKVCYWSRYNAPDQLQQEARHVREIHYITCAYPPVRSEAYTLNESRKQDCRGTSVGVHFH